MKIYIISKGKYSDGDYIFCAASLNRNKAEQIAEICSDANNIAEVTEYDTKIRRVCRKCGARLVNKPEYGVVCPECGWYKVSYTDADMRGKQK